MKKLVFVILFFCCGKLFAQDEKDYTTALIPKKVGAEVIYSGSNYSVTLDVNYLNIKPLEEPGYLNVNNKILQLVFIGNKVLQVSDTSIVMQKTLLLSYEKYETDYVKDQLKIDTLKIEHKWIILNNKLFLLWCYDMPGKKTKESVLQQLNLSTLCFAHALNLNTPVTAQDKFEDSENLLYTVAKTLHQNNFKLNFDEVYKKLNGK